MTFTYHQKEAAQIASKKLTFTTHQILFLCGSFDWHPNYNIEHNMTVDQLAKKYVSICQLYQGNYSRW
jgi:hypothetical protein